MLLSRLVFTLVGITPTSGCDSLAVLPSATETNLGGMYAKNADRHATEAQPVAAVPRQTHPKGSSITLDTGLVIPQVELTYAHAGAKPNWAHPHGGYSEGVNEFGVGIGNEMFPSHSLPSDHGSKPQAEFTDLGRLVLERSENADEAIQVFTDLVSKYGQTCKTCPSAANYNSLFMISDTQSIYSVMAVGHEWGYKKFTNADLDGTGVHTISNIYFKGADHISPTAISTARNHLGYKGSDEDFDFGYVYGSRYASPSRQQFTQKHLRELAQDHKLTKADLMETLSNSKVDFKGSSELTASSMVSDFTLDGKRKIAWHTGPNPDMTVYYPVIFHHDGRVSPMPDFLATSDAWWAFRYSIYEIAGRDQKKIQHIQDTWKLIQKQFFTQAEEAAVKAGEMDADAADAMLGALLKNMSNTIQSTLLAFNQTLPTWAATVEYV
jgi:dipeptidase